MKILRKGDQFIKMPDSTQNDLIKIHTMTERGWEFAQKKEYKTSNCENTKKKTKDEIKLEKKDKKIKDKNEVKEVKKDKDSKKIKKIK
jgi:hypothetical protein